MQLTILLYLLHLQGQSVPDKRTPLYDDYMKTFLNREAEKSTSVRDNRESLEEVTAFLGWHLQGLAEQHGSNGRLSTTDLKTEIFRYLTAAQKNTALVESLFTDVTDRVWALSSKVQGTFEFDVQPVREFFAAKFLSQYASVDKATVLNALIRRPFWFNTSRFFAGFAHANEVGGLVDGLTEEFAEQRHPLAARIATWTLLADGVFASKTTAQRRAVDLLCDDLGIRLLRLKNESAEPLPTLPSDRGSTMFCERLIVAAANAPRSAISREGIWMAPRLDVDVSMLEQWWRTHAAPKLGGPDETAWLDLGAALRVKSLLEPGDVAALALANTRAVCAAIGAGVSPAPGSSAEQTMLQAVLTGQCSDLAVQQTGLVPDLVNVLAPREFLHLAMPDDRSVFGAASAHCSDLMLAGKRQEAFRRLKYVDSAFGKIQQAMNTVRRSPNTVAPWSDAAEALREIYGPSWLAADIAVIGASINPTTRRDLGTMNPTRSTFGEDIDYGRLVNDVRKYRNRLQWWIDQRQSLKARDRSVWAYAIVAVATPSIVKTCLKELAEDIDSLDDDSASALLASSSRLGLSQVSRRLPADLVKTAIGISLPLAVLLSHHVDMQSAAIDLITVVPPDMAKESARLGPAAWPALHIAGLALHKTESPDWLAVLKAYGPEAAGGVALGPIPDDLCSRILNDAGQFPMQWVVVAEASRAQRNAEPPLAPTTTAWFDD
jgi:hypothetical protein